MVGEIAIRFDIHRKSGLRPGQEPGGVSNGKLGSFGRSSAMFSLFGLGH